MAEDSGFADYVQRMIASQFSTDDEPERMTVYATGKLKKQLEALARTLDTNRTQLASDLLERAVYEAIAALPDRWPDGVQSVRVMGITGEHEVSGPREAFMVHLGQEEAAARQGGWDAIVKAAGEVES